MFGTGFESGILQRMLAPDGGHLPPEVARFFLGLSFTEEDQSRLQVLSERANEGQLTAEERDELSTYVLLGDLLAIMQSRARVAMSQPSPAA